MSSSAFSSLSLDLRPPWAPLAAIVAWLILLGGAIVCCALPLMARLLAAGLLLAAALGGLLSQLFGLSARALTRITLQTDGHWLLTDGRGRQEAAELVQGRFAGQCALLLWRGDRRHWALVVPAAGSRTGLRRLRVRLRFS